MNLFMTFCFAVRFRFYCDLEVGSGLMSFGDIFTISSYENGTLLQCIKTMPENAFSSPFRTAKELSQCVPFLA